MMNRCLSLAAAALLTAACAPAPPGEQAPSPPPQSAAAARPALTAVVPAPAGSFAPAELRVDSPALRGDALTDAHECEGCHADAAAGWRASAHARASFDNPIYRAVVDRFREEVGLRESRFCGGCHDIALLVDGAMDRPVEPGDPRARAGVSCRVCHGVLKARADGNGSFELTAEPIPVPDPSDPASVAAHVARAAPSPLRTDALCASCHRAFLGVPTGNAHHLIGQDDMTPFQQSAHAGSLVHLLDEDVPARACRSCHMPREAATRGDAAQKGGRIASHRFTGGHTWLASMRGDDEALAAARAMLTGAASIDVAALVREDGGRALPADGAQVAPGERVLLDVVMRNLRVGHRFPGGTLDAQDTWVEIDARDATGARLAEAGAEQEATGDDPTAHRLRSLMVDEEGTPQLERQTNRFRAGVFSHAIPPRDAAVVEYALTVPAALPPAAFPLSITARLRHRTHNLAVQRAACEAARSARGQAFAAASVALDPCAPQPVTTVAEATVWLGPGAAARGVGGAQAARPVWQRLYEHGLGMLRARQERRDEAGSSLSRALELLGDGGDARPRAMVMAALGALAGRQGRVDEALAWFDRAAALAPDHPALAYGRGEALAGVWRFSLAEAPLASAAARAPGDDAAWALLAATRGSMGDPAGALSAARRGLAVQPRDEALLRVESLSLEALAAPPAEVEAARRAWEAFRPADTIPATRAKCSKRVPGCALERDPVHVHAMRPSPPHTHR